VEEGQNDETESHRLDEEWREEEAEGEGEAEGESGGNEALQHETMYTRTGRPARNAARLTQTSKSSSRKSITYEEEEMDQQDEEKERSVQKGKGKARVQTQNMEPVQKLRSRSQKGNVLPVRIAILTAEVRHLIHHLAVLSHFFFRMIIISPWSPHTQLPR